MLNLHTRVAPTVKMILFAINEALNESWNQKHNASKILRIEEMLFRCLQPD